MSSTAAAFTFVSVKVSVFVTEVLFFSLTSTRNSNAPPVKVIAGLSSFATLCRVASRIPFVAAVKLVSAD